MGTRKSVDQKMDSRTRTARLAVDEYDWWQLSMDGCPPLPLVRGEMRFNTALTMLLNDGWTIRCTYQGGLYVSREWPVISATLNKVGDTLQMYPSQFAEGVDLVGKTWYQVCDRLEALGWHFHVDPQNPPKPEAGDVTVGLYRFV